MLMLWQMGIISSCLLNTHPYKYISTSLIAHQKNFFVLWAEANTETLKVQRISNWGAQPKMGCLIPLPPSPRLRGKLRRGSRNIIKTRGGGGWLHGWWKSSWGPILSRGAIGSWLLPGEKEYVILRSVGPDRLSMAQWTTPFPCVYGEHEFVSVCYIKKNREGRKVVEIW